MEWKSLILGLTMAFSVFALKSGAGLFYVVDTCRSASRRWVYRGVYSASYLILFAFAYYSLTRLDIIDHVEIFQNLTEAAMGIHVLMAAGFLFWAIQLLRTVQRNHIKPSWNRAWITLIIPCPVCLTVIVLTTALLISLFPERAWYSTFGGYALFVIISLSASFVIQFIKNRRQLSAESILGGAMLFTAAYFILSVLLIPHWSDLDKVYRIASVQAEKSVTDAQLAIEAVIVVVVLFLLGFGMKLRTIRRFKRCK